MKGGDIYMSNLIDFVGALVARMQREEGQTMVEYAFLVAFIAVIVLVGVQLLGTNLLGFFNSIAGKV
jgi:pilus assembly protein Flp/PilA